MKSLITSLIIATIIIVVGCTYDKREIANPNIVFRQDSCKDTVHFGVTLQPIITNSCALPGCHVGHGGGAGAFDYTVFANVQMEDSAIYTRITEPTTNTGVGGFMPKTGQPLSPDQIQAFYCWWKQGGQNN
jgi:hypothetical protein